MLWSRRFVLLLTVVGLLVTGGCRTYGGYDSEPKTYKAMRSTVDSFESDLNRAEANLRRLEEAATERDTLQSFVREFRGLVEKHKSLLEKQKRRLQRLSRESSYRALHRAYGATITERRLMRRRYQRTIRTLGGAVQGSAAVQAPSPDAERHYTTNPIGFPDSEPTDTLSLEEALQGR